MELMGPKYTYNSPLSYPFLGGGLTQCFRYEQLGQKKLDPMVPGHLIGFLRKLGDVCIIYTYIYLFTYGSFPKEGDLNIDPKIL